MARFIDPLYDTAFKLIFGQENSKELLLDFLNALLAGEKKIREIRFEDKERMPFYIIFVIGHCITFPRRSPIREKKERNGNSP